MTAPPGGRRIVDAGAGTGKTSTLALRALWLIELEHVRADRIVVVTFTNKAAAEIGSRIADTLDRAIENGASLQGAASGVRCTTIHALAADIRHENAFDLGFDAAPRTISDGQAHAIFHGAFRELLNDRLDVDTAVFPLAEMNLADLERDLGKLALRLKNHGISPADFEERALVETDRFGRQTWGQIYSPGSKKPNSRKGLSPTEAVRNEEIVREAGRERANVRVVATLFREFDRRLREEGAATYGDLIGATTNALRARPDLVRRLRARWRYVLLDESQDTSDLQLAFIDVLFGQPSEPDAAGMMPVGDRRQAIYGFNGADERVMQRLAKLTDATYALVENRRSFQEIVDAGHAVLASAGIVDETTPKLKAFGGSGGLDCVRVQNFGEAEPLKERVQLEAAAIAREIERLTSDGATQPSDIAILVRRRTHAAVYLRELNRRGIPGALDRRNGLFVADEIRDILAWMAWLLDLGNRQAAVRVLQSPLCGLSDATTIELAARRDWLDGFLRNDLAPNDSARAPREVSPSAVGRLDADTQARLRRVRELLVDLLPAVSLPLPEAMDRIMNALPIAATYVALGEREGTETIGAQAIVNLASFDVLAREFAIERPGARLQEFVEDIDRRVLYDDDVEEPELDLDGVRILTIHQAKGLEWPYVFVACATRNQYGVSDPSSLVVKYDLSSGALALKHDVDGRETLRWICVGADHDPATGERILPAPRKESASREQARVFYVALTRAKRRVYVTAPAAPPQGDKLGEEAPFLAAIRAWAQTQDAAPDLRFEVEGTPQAGFGGRVQTMVHVVQREAVRLESTASTYRPRISFTSISAFETCPRQARYRYRLLLPGLRDARPRFVGFDGNDTPLTANAARLGSLAHRALEIWGRSRLVRPIVASVAYADAFAVALDEFDGVTPGDVSRARAAGERAVEALSGYVLLKIEEPFELVVGQTLVTGAVDLIARDPRGTLVVVDYKTGTVGGEKYELQLELYRRVAEERFPDERVEAAILRLTPEKAAFERASPLPPADVLRTVDAVENFNSDEPKVGDWCVACAYRGSPCRAPLDDASRSNGDHAHPRTTR